MKLERYRHIPGDKAGEMRDDFLGDPAGVAPHPGGIERHQPVETPKQRAVRPGAGPACAGLMRTNC